MNTTGIGVDRPGAFADYISVPAFNVFKLPDAISDEMASILDPLGNATHTALSFDLVGEDVLITGAGPIGVMAVAIAKFAGARHVVITDVNDYRLDLARKMGATVALNVTHDSVNDTMQALGMEEGFDVGLEMSGNPSAFRDMLAPDPGFRPSFLGHILVELLLDAALIEQSPGQLDAYYAAIDSVAPNEISTTVNQMITCQTGMLVFFIPRFSAARFLYDYGEDDKLLFRLNKVMRRVRLAPLPKEILSFFPEARKLVKERQDELLAGEGAMLNQPR